MTSDNESGAAGPLAQASPLQASPTALAFYAALDQSSNKRQAASTRIQQRAQSLGWRNRHSQSQFYPVHLNGGTTFTVQQVQRGELEETYGTGATVWPASMVLLYYLQQESVVGENVVGQRIVELGAGTGLVSAGVACLGAAHVCCTDGEASVVGLARDNLARVASELSVNDGFNGKAVLQPTEPATLQSTAASPAHDSPLYQSADTDANTATVSATATEDDGDTNERNNNKSDTFVIAGRPVSVQYYWWGSNTLSSTFKDETAFDLVLVSDCVLPKLYPIEPLVQALDELLVKPSAMALLSYEERYYPEYDPKERFCELARQYNLTVETIPRAEHDPVYSVDDIEIWRVRRSEKQTL
jgi:predicted nicotinamide N-methyase